jgi:hypothetical protein
MAFYVVDMSNRVIQRVPRGYSGVDNQRFLLIKAGSAKQARAKITRLSARIGSAECASCRHCHCRDCEECSVARQYSDYWICHCCGELNLRVPNLNLREVSHGLGKN